MQTTHRVISVTNNSGESAMTRRQPVTLGFHGASGRWVLKLNRIQALKFKTLTLHCSSDGVSIPITVNLLSGRVTQPYTKDATNDQ
eukprot:5817937-Amphidinium_carterae.1